jgi:hypothetical protein
VINVKNKSHSVTAAVTVPESGADGVIIAQGGAFAGWSLYVKDGRPKYAYNLFGIQQFHVESDAEVPPGAHQVRMEFTYDGGGLGKGGDVALYLDGAKTGEGRVEGTVPMVFSADETATSAPTRPRRSATTTPLRAAGSPAPSSGSRSTSRTPPRTSITSSRPRSACGSR